VTVRGYFGIGIEHPVKTVNLGTLWRSAYCFNADFIFTIGARYQPQCSDTTKAYRHVPYWRFHDWEDFHSHIPYDCQLVGVELLESAIPLETFKHPERVIYLLGPEDGSLSKEAVKHCQYIVKFDSKKCLNVASAGTVVMYDRQLKFAK
jgi:tRNA G18 (ribose-2'-O)-methylase SpoU